MYNFLLKSVFNKSVSYNDINKSLSTFKQTQIRLIYSNSIYSKLYLFIKNLLCKTGYIENKIYSKHTHCINDLLSEKKSPWIDPFSKEEHNESLINIYYDSEHLYQEIVNIFYQYIHNNKKMVDIPVSYTHLYLVKDGKFAMSYDNALSIFLKGQYVLRNCLGGIFAWTSTYDQANILAKYMYQSIYDPDALKSELEQVFGQF